MGLSDWFRWPWRDDEPGLSLDRPDLVVVARAYEDGVADSAALKEAEAGLDGRATPWRPNEEAVLRHHLRLPVWSMDEATKLLAQDGWTLRLAAPVTPDTGDRPRQAARPMVLQALRVERLDALRCAQERSRMASLAQRLGGLSLGWDALQPAPDAPAADPRQ